MKKEDWISTKKNLPDDPDGKLYLIHIPEDDNKVRVCNYDTKQHKFVAVLGSIAYTVDEVDFWTEIKQPAPEEDSLYRFHEGMAIQDWKNIVYIVKEVKERSYTAFVYGDPSTTPVSIPIAIQKHYTIIKGDKLDLLKPKFLQGTEIKDTNTKEIWQIASICDARDAKFYNVSLKNGSEVKRIYFGEQSQYIPYYNFEDGDTVRRKSDGKLFWLRKNQQEEYVPQSPTMTTFYEQVRRLEFYLVPVDDDGSSISSNDISRESLEGAYEIVQKHDKPFDIKDYIKK